jgi:hypothetical protein
VSSAARKGVGLTMQGAPGCEGAASRHAWRVQQQAAALESVKGAQGISSTADTQQYPQQERQARVCSRRHKSGCRLADADAPLASKMLS